MDWPTATSERERRPAAITLSSLTLSLSARPPVCHHRQLQLRSRSSQRRRLAVLLGERAVRPSGTRKRHGEPGIFISTVVVEVDSLAAPLARELKGISEFLQLIALFIVVR